MQNPGRRIAHQPRIIGHDDDRPAIPDLFQPQVQRGGMGQSLDKGARHLQRPIILHHLALAHPLADLSGLGRGLQPPTRKPSKVL